MFWLSTSFSIIRLVALIVTIPLFVIEPCVTDEANVVFPPFITVVPVPFTALLKRLMPSNTILLLLITSASVFTPNITLLIFNVPELSTAIFDPLQDLLIVPSAFNAPMLARLSF